MNPETVKKLATALSLHSSKKPSNKRSSSIAISKSGHEYIAGRVETDTHLLDTASEQNALMLSALNKDCGVNKIVTLLEDPESKSVVNPIVVKAIIDHQIRTGISIEYVLIDMKGAVLFETDNVKSIFPSYDPKSVPLKMVIENPDPSSNKAKVDLAKMTPDSIRNELKRHAMLGIARNFPQYDSASGYGTAVITKKGNIYFGGQYSSFDNRLGFHSEMTTIISSLMDNEHDITHLGIVSTKYPDSHCDCCGICRQFMAEMSERFGWDLKIFNFALNAEEYKENSIQSYLPSQWSNTTRIHKLHECHK